MRARTRLWAAAGGLSLAIHASLGALALALMPETGRQPARETAITIEEIETRTTSLTPARATRAHPAPVGRVDPIHPAAQPLSAAEPRMRLGPGDSGQRPVALAPSASTAPALNEPTPLAESRPQPTELAAVQPDAAVATTARSSPPVPKPETIAPATPTAVAAAELRGIVARPAAPLPAESAAPRPLAASPSEAVAATTRLAEVARISSSGELAGAAPGMTATRASPEPLSPLSTSGNPAAETVRPAPAEFAVLEPQSPEPTAAVPPGESPPEPTIAARTPPSAIEAAGGSGNILVLPKLPQRAETVAAVGRELSPTGPGPTLQAADAGDMASPVLPWILRTEAGAETSASPLAPRMAARAQAAPPEASSPAPIALAQSTGAGPVLTANRADESATVFLPSPVQQHRPQQVAASESFETLASRRPQPGLAVSAAILAATAAETMALAAAPPAVPLAAQRPSPVAAARPTPASSGRQDETLLTGETAVGTMAPRAAPEEPPALPAPTILDARTDPAARLAASAAVPGRLAEATGVATEAVPPAPLTGQVSGQTIVPRVTAEVATASAAPDIADGTPPDERIIRPNASEPAEAAAAVSAIVPGRIAPVGPSGIASARPGRIAPAPAARRDEAELAALSPRRPQTIAGTPGDTPEEAQSGDDGPQATLAELVAAYPGGDCFAALTEAGKAAGEFRITALSDDQGRLEDFADTLIEQSPKEAFRRVYIDGGEVAEAQCRALASLPDMPGYPAYGLTLELDQRRIVSGRTLAGSIAGVPAGGTLDLLLVDDEGLVQSLSAYLTRKGATARFEVPVTASDPATRTAQILIALTLPEALIHADGAGGEPAGPFFEELAETLAAKGLKGEFAVDHFLVRPR